MKNIDVGLIGLGILAMLFCTRIGYFEDWTVLLVIPLAILNGYINSKAIQKNKVGRKWHDIQYYILLTLLGVLVLVGLIDLKAVVFIMALYWVFFEISLNQFNDWDWDWVGTTGRWEKLMRKVFKTLATRRVYFVVSKIFALFAGYLIYMWNILHFDFMP